MKPNATEKVEWWFILDRAIKLRSLYSKYVSSAYRINNHITSGLVRVDRGTPTDMAQ